MNVPNIEMKNTFWSCDKCWEVPCNAFDIKIVQNDSLPICICICIWSYRQKNLVIPASEDNPIALSLNKSKKTLRLFLHLWRACHHLEKFEIFLYRIISSLLMSLLFPLVFTLQSTFLRPPIWHRSSAPCPRNKVGWFSHLISKAIIINILMMII